MPTTAVDPRDRQACATLYSSVQARANPGDQDCISTLWEELEACLDYLLRKREEDPYEPVLPRAAAEASWGFEKQAPTFPLDSSSRLKKRHPLDSV
ncbi:MAG: hypothetical protein SGPRY_007022 [Prymnesium sp.]